LEQRAYRLKCTFSGLFHGNKLLTDEKSKGYPQKRTFESIKCTFSGEKKKDYIL